MTVSSVNLMAGLVLAVAIGVSAQANDKGKIVAKVNGVALYEMDVFEPGYLEQTPALSPQQLSDQIQQAVHNELLFQEAKRRGADQDPGFLKTWARQSKSVQQGRLAMLAGILQEKDEQLQNARNPDAISEEEIVACFEENADRFAQIPPAQAQTEARSLLVWKRYQTAYQALMNALVGEIQVSINGNSIAAETLQQAVAAFVPTSTTLKPDTEAAADALLTAFSDAAGIDPAGENPAAAQPGEPDLSAEKLEAVAIKVGTSEFKYGDFYSGSERPTAQALFRLLGNHLLAEETRKRGLDRDPDYLKQVNTGILFDGDHELQIIDKNPEKQLLIRTFLKKEGYYGFDKIEVTDAEIDASAKAHATRYERFAKRENGGEIIRKLARQQLQTDRGRQVKDAFVTGLRNKAKIEIAD